MYIWVYLQTSLCCIWRRTGYKGTIIVQLLIKMYYACCNLSWNYMYYTQIRDYHLDTCPRQANISRCWKWDVCGLCRWATLISRLQRRVQLMKFTIWFVHHSASTGRLRSTRTYWSHSTLDWPPDSRFTPILQPVASSLEVSMIRPRTGHDIIPSTVGAVQLKPKTCMCQEAKQLQHVRILLRNTKRWPVHYSQVCSIA